MSEIKTPILSMNLISTKLSVGDAIKYYHDAGYSGIGLWYDQVCEYGIERVCALLQEIPIKVTHLIYAGPFNQTNEKDYMMSREADKEKIRVARRLGADTILAMTGPINGLSKKEAFRQLERSLRDLAETARQNDVKIGLEPLNYILQQDSFIFTLAEAMDIIEAVDHANVGVFIDVYHIWFEPGLMDTLKRVKGKVVGCHICDFRPINRSVYDRVLMGDGVIPIRKILNALKESGWDKWFDIEIFSHELWEMEPKKFLQVAKEKYNQLWK